MRKKALMEGTIEKLIWIILFAILLMAVILLIKKLTM